MTMWENLPTYILSALAVLTSIGMFVWTLWKDNKGVIATEAVAASLSKSTGAALDILSVRVSSIELRLVDVRVEMAKDYVSRAMFETSETRLLQAIDGVRSAVESMSGRLDRAFERPINTAQHR